MDPPAGGLDQDSVLLSWGEAIEPVAGVSRGLRAVCHQTASVVQNLQDVSVSHAQSFLPVHLEAAGGVEVIHLEPRHC